MKLPDDALIASEKLTHYLLVFQPESDKSKFLAQAGFTHSNPEALEIAIRQMIVTHEAVFDSHNRYGDFYRVEGTLQALTIMTCWL